MRRNVFAAALLITLGATAISPAGELHRRCVDAGITEAVCETVLALEDGLARPGISFADFTSDAGASIEIADFYFSPRISIVRNRQAVGFTNTNAPGGNPHSVASSDWNGDEPVLPLPFAGFGGGGAFRSAKLGPGEPFTVVADVAALDPAGSVLLPNGDALIPYHCYIHGAAQMSGVLVVRDAAS